MQIGLENNIAHYLHDWKNKITMQSSAVVGQVKVVVCFGWVRNVALQFVNSQFFVLLFQSHSQSEHFSRKKQESKLRGGEQFFGRATRRKSPMRETTNVPCLLFLLSCVLCLVYIVFCFRLQLSNH